MNKSSIHPVGWRILVKPKVINNMTESGIALPDEVIQKDEIVAQVGQVVEMGGTVFSDEKLFPGRAPYQTGDWVLFAAHTGHEVLVEVEGKQERYRLMNDDHILGRADDPSLIKSTVI